MNTIKQATVPAVIAAVVQLIIDIWFPEMAIGIKTSILAVSVLVFGGPLNFGLKLWNLGIVPKIEVKFNADLNEDGVIGIKNTVKNE